MINKQEILDHAQKYKLDTNIIEKDYILNWLLAGIANSEALRDTWVFKGGTCLKKCYFEEYRFSEDLDFTIVDQSHIDANFLKTEFSNISEWIYEQSGIECPIESLNFEEYKNPREKISIQGKVAYKGPMQRRSNSPTIKLDLSNDEILVEEPIQRKIHHPYTDFRSADSSIKTYCIEEIFSEKLRALIERTRPRDLYDIVHLHNDSRWQLQGELVLNILRQKCEYKGIDLPTLENINSLPSRQELASDWKHMLAHQIADLESYEYYWNQLSAVFKWLYQKA